MSLPPSDLTVSQLIAAHQCYQAGQLAEAETLYRQMLKQDPEQIAALTWLALIVDQLGRPEESIAYYDRLLSLQPSAEVHSNLGTLLCRLGRVQEGLEHQQQAVALKPDQPETHYNLGVILSQIGQIDQAIAHYQQVIALAPNYGAAHNNLAMALYKQGKLEDAIAHYQQAVVLNPNHVNALNGLGVALFHHGQVEQAIEHYERAIALKPDSFSSYNNLGTALQKQGKLEEAATYYQQALALNPEYASAHDNLGTVLQEQGKVEAAIASYRRALALDPNLANAYNNLGSALQAQGRVDEAIASCLQAIQLQPDHADAHNNYASGLVDRGDFGTAIEYYKQAIYYKPNHANAHLNLGIVLLLLGDLKQGFEEYHWRWQNRQCASLRYPNALWDGSDLNGKVILLTAEQGYGDTIQFARYASLVAQRGGHVVIACQKPLLRLLNTIPGIDRCVDRANVDVQTHVHAPLLDLPLLLGTTLETIPSDVPYLTPSSDFHLPIAADCLTLQTPHPTPFKIGIVWAANPDSSTSGKRSCGLERFLSLLNLSGVALYSLQKNPTEADLALLEAHPIVQLHEQLQDFADTAAAIAQLDLVISVDTAVAHLAGALGKPVWTLLANVADWRWLRDRDDTPWYPTMRLFRQAQEGDWDGVFEEVAEALRSVLEQGEGLGVTAEAQRRREMKPAVSSQNHLSSLTSQSAKPSSTPHTPHPIPHTTNGFNQLKACRHGTFLYNQNDLYIGRSLELYGEWSEGEVALFQPLIRSGDTVVEVGANIGTHTVFFAKAVGSQGRVLAIEPQRIVFQTLCANLALNSLTNVHAYAIGLGEAPGFAQIPILDYHQLNNYGGVSLSHNAAETQAVGEQIQIATLDSFALPQCHLLKIDVEGMELQVLQGATETIQRCQPILYIENDRQDKATALIQYLVAIGYELYWHCPPIYNVDNFLQNPQNVFGNTISVNMLGLLPTHRLAIEGLERVSIADTIASIG
ncbi:MAG: FkbM family methyltransferase [Tildeniella nuda ZEHNDER 1965/U140]|jgi:FkbM family methyltransferase|nr:FkbM family methyltransferase [Tildeniella nuda ZEHNDER 1965/U140]